MAADLIQRESRVRRGIRAVNPSGLLFIVALGLIWELAVRSGALTYEYLPAPSSTIKAGVDLIVNGTLIEEVVHTSVSALVGWGIGSVIGVVFGTCLGLFPTSWRYSMSSVEVLRALPAIAFVPAVVLVLGFSLEAEFVITTYVAIWPVLVNTIAGVRDVSPAHLELATMMRMSALERVRKVLLPSAAPLIVIGLRLSLSLTLALALVAEMVGNPEGVGYALILQQQALQPAAMFSYVIAIGIVGLLFNTIFVAVVRLVSPGTTALIDRESS